MNTYELMVVYSPTLSEVKQKKEFQTLKLLVEKYKGKVVKADHWGKRPLAYLIGKESEGFYAVWQLELPAAGPAQVLQELKVNEAIMRYLLVKREKEKSTKSTKSIEGTKSIESIEGTESTKGRKGMKKSVKQKSKV